MGRTRTELESGVSPIQKSPPPPHSGSRRISRLTQIAREMVPGDSILCATERHLAHMRVKLAQAGKSTTSARDGQYWRLWCVERKQ